MELFSINRSVRRFFSVGDYETDSDFEALLAATARRGLLVAGVLGALGALAFSLSHIFFVGKTMVWSYEGYNPGEQIILLDKVVILLASVTGIVLSRVQLGLTEARWLAAALAWCISMAIVLDDVLARDISFSPAYLVLVLALVTSAVSFKAYQSLLLTLGVGVSYFVLAAYFPAVVGLPPVRIFSGHAVFLALFAGLITGISSFMYISRFEQYSARRKVEQLKESLEDRARALEAEKAKTEEQARQVRELERAKDRFFSNVSHELRTPLTLILGPVTDAWHAARRGDGELSAADLDMIYRNGLRLQHQINQLLDLSKVGSDVFILHVRSTNLPAFVRDIAESFRPLANRREIHLDVDCPEEGCDVYFNSELIEKVILNLLSNAMKFTVEGGTVRIAVSPVSLEGEDAFQISVRDTGIGIAPDELDHIFDRIHQASHPGRRTYGSTGIGLALCKEIVELHGGKIEVESEPDFGSRFAVTLRTGCSHFGRDVIVDEEDAPDMSAFAGVVRNQRLSYVESSMTDQITVDQDAQAESTADPDAPLVLIVEDHADVRTYLRNHLSGDYRVAEATNGREGLEKVNALKPALVLCDIMMPELDGLEVCRQIKTNRDTSHIPVVILTARADDESKLEGLGTMADDFMAKPFNAAELTMRVENLIELRRMLRARYAETVDISATKISVSSYEARFLEQVRTVIEKHLSNSNFGVDWLADEVAISPRQLQRRLRASLRLSAAGYIRMIRLQRAAQLLAQGAGTVSEVTNQVGFQDATHFSRLFRQAYGVVPSEYRGETDGLSVGVEAEV